MSLDPKLFRSTLGKFATGVTVVTAESPSMKRGMTANAFSSLSLEPPLVLVCVDNKATFLSVIRDARKYVINFLADDQKAASDWFAGKGRDAEDQFADIAHEKGENGGPVLSGALASLECEIHEDIPGGDHAIIVGRVTRIVADEDVRPPLMFYASAYRKMDMDGEV